MPNKITRSICYFTKTPDANTLKKLDRVKKLLTKNDFEVQTLRLCSPSYGFQELESTIQPSDTLLSIGSLNFGQTKTLLPDFLKAKNVSFNLEAGGEILHDGYVDILFDIIENRPELTFNFTYGFNLPASSPFYPSANYEQEGFSIGLQSTDLAENCDSLYEWFANQKSAWEEIVNIMDKEEQFLGIDSSIAPLNIGKSSLINFVKRLGFSFDQSVVTDIYMQMTKFIKTENPKPVGLNGLMFAGLEDFELTDEYSNGSFDIERNIYLSLHSGLGIDVYPIGINEDKQKILNILKTVQGLSEKYQKPLAIRFVSDGKSKIGDKTNFKNKYLKDVVIRTL